MRTVYFHTNRLDVRRFTYADVPTLSAYRADPVAARCQSWSDYGEHRGATFVGSVATTELGTPGEWIQLALQDRTRGVLVGVLECKVNAVEQRELEICFTPAPREQRRGYATEAVEGLLRHAFTAMNMRRVVAVTEARTAAAAGLLTRVGMRQEAHLAENVFFKGRVGNRAALRHPRAREQARRHVAPHTNHREEHP